MKKQTILISAACCAALMASLAWADGVPMPRTVPVAYKIGRAHV